MPMQRYGLVGFPLSHSFSARFFADKFAAEGRPARYDNYEMATVDGLRAMIEATPKLRGLNVTIPHKEAVMAQLDALSPEAQRIGAVNVIRIARKAGGQIWLEGCNSDVVGFSQSLAPLLQAHHRHALVLGTGGASKAVVVALHDLGIAPIYVTRRATAPTLAVGGREVPVLTYEQITPELLATHHLLVNCTPLGMSPHVEAMPPIAYDALTDQHLLYDLIYNPLETRFLTEGRARGAATKNGLEMLHLQALAAWDMWQRP